jgi:hypothetical protein
MSQAFDLLNTLSDDDVVAYSDNTGGEHIVIGDDRVIRIPDSLKRLAVQHDHDIETVTFDCPRYWDKHDMSRMKIYINYLLPNGTKDRYAAKNVTAVGGTMHFDWTISNNVTQYQGGLSFLVCVVKTDADGNEELHWNSELNQEAYISEGLECKETALRKYPDIITHLLTRMDEVEAIATPEAMQTYTDAWLEENHERILAEIEAKGAATLNTIPEDYTETYNMAKESVRTKADAIVCTAEGEGITVSDSSDDHIRNLRVFGKTTQAKTTGAQLFNPYAEQNNSFGNATIHGDGSEIAVVGTYYVSWPIVLKAGVTYYINFETAGVGAQRAVRFEYGDKEITNTITNPAAFTPTRDTVSVYLYSGLGTENCVVYKNLMISEGDSPVPWEPYSAGRLSPSPDWPQPLRSVESPEVTITGKNLLDMSTNGYYVDGVLKIPYTSYNSISGGFNKIRVYPGRTYTFSYKCATGDRIIFNFLDKDMQRIGDVKIGWGQYVPAYNGRYGAVGNGATFTIPEDSNVAYLDVRMCQMNECGEGNFNYYYDLQLEEGAVATEYEPYKEYKILTPYMLNGIPVTSGGNYTDANGQQWICDEVDFERGVYIWRICEVVIDGTVAPTVFSPGTNGGSAFGFNYSYIGIDDILRDRCPKLCDKLLPMSDATIASWKLCEIGRWGFNTDGSADNFLIMNVGEFESADAVQTWLKSNHVTFQYILRTPIETPMTNTELANFKMVCTNYPHTTVLNDAGAHMELSYNADTKTYVDNGIKKSVTDVLEAIENGSY